MASKHVLLHVCLPDLAELVQFLRGYLLIVVPMIDQHGMSYLIWNYCQLQYLANFLISHT